MYEIRITNMLRIVEAQIELTPGKITCVQGHNAAGKTSIATLVAGILSSNANPAGSAKAAKNVYVHDGEESGFVDLVNPHTGDSMARWDGRAGELATFGQNIRECSDGAVGLIDFCAGMSGPARTALWEQYFLPPERVLIDMIQQQLKPMLSESQLKDVMGMITEGDLDVVAKTYEKWMREAKRKWMEVAGSNWGKAKAADWLPEGWTHSLDGITTNEAKESLELAREELRSHHVTLAISAADVEKAKEALQRMQVVEHEIEQLRKLHMEQEEALKPMSVEASRARKVASELMAKLASLLGDDRPEKHIMPCPECEAPLMMDMIERKLIKHDLKAENSAMKKRREDRAKLENEVMDAEEKVKALHEVMEPKVKASNATAREIAELVGRLEELKIASRLASEEPTEDNRIAVDDAEARVDELRSNFELIEQRARAFRHHEDVLAYEMILKTLGPKGVRATSMEQAMVRFDNTLGTIAKVTGWPRVTLDRSYAISIGNRTLLRVCAESERLRAQYALQIAIARCQREPVVVLDGVDHLDHRNRLKLMDLLDALCKRPDPPAFMMCGTNLDNVTLNPDGINYTVEDGKVLQS